MRCFGRRYAAALALVAAVVLSGAAGAQAKAAPPCSAGTVVQTTSGPVCGVSGKGQTNYLDIRYAAPPVGALRFAPPQPAQPSTSTYRATRGWRRSGWSR